MKRKANPLNPPAFFIVDVSKTDLIMKPKNDYFKNDIGWKSLHNLLTYFDVYSVMYSPNIHIY